MSDLPKRPLTENRKPKTEISAETALKRNQNFGSEKKPSDIVLDI